MAGGLAAQGAIAAAYIYGPDGSTITGMDQMKVQEGLAAVWIAHGVAEWTFLDDRGRTIPVTPENVRRALPYGRGGRLVADKADELYNEAVLAPLVELTNELSRRSSTSGSPRATSPNRASRRSQQKRSSTATTGRGRPAV